LKQALWLAFRTFIFKNQAFSPYTSPLKEGSMNDLYVYQDASPKDWIQLLVQDPSDLEQHGYPQTVYRLQVFLKDFYLRLVQPDKLAKPLSDLLDEHIVALNLEFEQYINPEQRYQAVLPYAAQKLAILRPSNTIYNCSLCGGGLDTAFCRGCDTRFQDDLQRVAWPATLPDKVVSLLLDIGHQFEQDPQKAHKKEKAAAQFPIFGLGG